MPYTQNWNNEFITNINRFGIKNLNLCLEIGCFEGLTSNFIIDNVLNKENGKLICIDPLKDIYLNNDLTEVEILGNQTYWAYFKDQYSRFCENTKKAFEENKIELYRKISSEAFPELLEKYENKIDLIYIDGDHRAKYVYLDAINSFELCKQDGIIIFDDYGWEAPIKEESTKFGIEKFLLEYSGKYDLLEKHFQVVIKKN